MPDDHPPDPEDTADFELPDQQELIDAFTAGLCPVKAKNEIVPRRGGQGAPGRAAQSRSVGAQKPGPLASPPPDGAPRRGIRRRAGRRAGLLRPGRCARDCAARPGALPRYEIRNTSGQ